MLDVIVRQAGDTQSSAAVSAKEMAVAASVIRGTQTACEATEMRGSWPEIGMGTYRIARPTPGAVS
jgi:hypothetical protein